jgi:hypothetical protein
MTKRRLARLDTKEWGTDLQRDHSVARFRIDTVRDRLTDGFDRSEDSTVPSVSVHVVGKTRDEPVDVLAMTRRRCQT